MSRVRNRAISLPYYPVTGVIRWHSLPSGPWHYNLPATVGVLSANSSQMSDVVGNNGKFNPVNHTRLEFKRTAWPSGWTEPTAIAETTWDYAREPHPILLGPYEWKYLIAPLQAYEYCSEHSAFCTDAFFALTEEIPPSNQGLYLLQDLLELKSLMSGAGELMHRLSDTLHTVYRRNTSIQTVKDVLRLIADGHLSYLFGFKATLDDISLFAQKFTVFYSQLQFLRKTRGQLITRRMSRNHTISYKPEVYLTNGGTLGHQHIARPVRGYAKSRAQIVLKNELEGLDGLTAELKAFAASVGLGHIVAFAWDLVPYSFVIDWFFGIQKILSEYARVGLFDGKLIVHDSLSSFKSQIEYDIAFHPAPGSGNLEQHLGKLFWKHYVRQPSLSCSLSSILGGSISLSEQQQAILLSLAIQRSV